MIIFNYASYVKLNFLRTQVFYSHPPFVKGFIMDEWQIMCPGSKVHVHVHIPG